jgi:hypothetical protein
MIDETTLLAHVWWNRCALASLFVIVTSSFVIELKVAHRAHFDGPKCVCSETPTTFSFFPSPFLSSLVEICTRQIKSKGVLLFFLYQVWSLFFWLPFVLFWIIVFFLILFLNIWFHYIFISNLIIIFLIVICFILHRFLIDFFFNSIPHYLVDWQFHFEIFLKFFLYEVIPSL